ncbi:O-antigen ligase family protein [Nocardioides ferulae]|uniref:O-antigen ligase family protein n=1 Tax=Nocardioides ferulae TaxID=2340821 RepID=UPI000EB37693|nr:O-antigen ligase family protein [Nocardioides ferulae]
MTSSDDRALVERAALPLALLLLGYPLWWALGVQLPLWALVTVPLTAWLLRHRDQLALPPGYGVLLLFFGWVLLSGLMLDGLEYAASYLLRLAVYVTVLCCGFFVWNALRRGLRAWTVVSWLVAFWAAAVLLSYPGLLSANLEFTSPFEWLLDRLGVHDPFVTALTHPEFSEYDVVYGVPRPSPLFAYTNDWGAAMGVFTPVAVWAMLQAPTARLRWAVAGTLALSLPPIVMSVNRGCWISLGVALGYVAIRRVAAGSVGILAGLLTIVGSVAALLAFVPEVQRVVSARFDFANTSTRETLYEASLRLAAGSPLFGHGAPQSSEGLADSNDVSIGTHGQLWTVLVSQGFAGALLFLGGVLAVWWHARPRDGRSPDLWLHAAGPALLVQTVYYEVVPLPLTVVLLALAVTALHRDRPPLPTPVTRTGTAAAPRPVPGPELAPVSSEGRS